MLAQTCCASTAAKIPALPAVLLRAEMVADHAGLMASPSSRTDSVHQALLQRLTAQAHKTRGNLCFPLPGLDSRSGRLSCARASMGGLGLKCALQWGARTATRCSPGQHIWPVVTLNQTTSDPAPPLDHQPSSQVAHLLCRSCAPQMTTICQNMTEPGRLHTNHLLRGKGLHLPCNVAFTHDLQALPNAAQMQCFAKHNSLCPPAGWRSCTRRLKAP